MANGRLDAGEDSKGKAEEISTASILFISGPFYGLLMFLPVMFIMAMARNGRAARAAQMGRMGPQGMGGSQGMGQGPPRAF